jgi:predicted ribosome quality control (RQC) complex YloA/Tae2 family protein
MSLSAAELAVVAEELGALVGAFVQKVHVPRPGVCYLEVRQVGRSTQVCVSTEPGSARLSVATSRAAVEGAPPSLQRALRDRLAGLRLSAVKADGRDVALSFEKPGHAWTLHARLEGRGWLWLESAAGTVGTAPVHRERGRGGLDKLGLSGSVHPERSRGAPFLQLNPGEKSAEPFPLARAAEALLASRGEAQRARAAQDAQRARLSARRAKLARTLEKVRAEADRMPLAEEHRGLGELLSRNTERLPRGATSVRLTEYRADGPTAREVPLDPRRTPKEQSAWHFKEYRRLARGCEIAGKRAAVLEAELRELDARMAAAEPAPAKSPSPRRPSRAVPYHEYTSHGGRIWVGKDARGNDALSFSIAKPHDVWIHVRGAPGAHVVVRLDKKGELSQEVLLDAAHLALYHSTLKDEPRGEVAYTRVKHVRRVKGGAPGQVTYTHEKTFVLRVERDRLTRVLHAVTQSDRTP